MLYPKIQPLSLLSTREEDFFQSVLPRMGMAVILFDGIDGA